MPREATRGKRDRNDNGCPDRELLKPETKLNAGFYCTNGVCHGIKVKKLVISEIPRGTRVTVSCTKHACKKVSKKVGKSRQRSVLQRPEPGGGRRAAITLSRKRLRQPPRDLLDQAERLEEDQHCLKSGKPVRCSQQLLVR